MAPASHIFRAYDIRGRYPAELNSDVMFLLGRALASVAAKKGHNVFHLGRDGRLSSPELSQAMEDGLIAGGMHVKNIGLGPTPLLYYATMRDASQCGAMITGSHNPSDYNGCKMTIGGKSLAGDNIQHLHQLIADKNFVDGKGSVEHINCLDDFVHDALANSSKLSRPLKLVIDAGNGATSELAPRLFRAPGCEVIELYCEIDGTFPNHHPDPGKMENLVDLQQAVAQHQADIGFAFDGDGDRLGIVTNKGEVVFPDRALMLFADDLLKRHPGATVLMDVKCSPLVYRHIEQSGGKPQLCPTGHSLIKLAMKKTGALLAGEMSGHMFFAENWNGCDDALLAGVRLLSLLSNSEKSSSEIFQSYPSWHGTSEINITTTEEQKWQVIESLKKQGDFGKGRLISTDGIRIEYQDSWGLIRCSNTTPTLVLRFEGETTSALSKTARLFGDQIAMVAPELDLSSLQSAVSCE